MSYKRVVIKRDDFCIRCPSSLWEACLKQAELRRLCLIPLKSEEARKQLMLWRMYSDIENSAYLCLYNRRFRCVRVMCVFKHNVRLRESYVEALTEAMKETGAVYFSVVHNHVNEPMVPSPDDLALTNTFMRCAKERLGGESAYLGHYITDQFKMVIIDV